MGARPFRLDAHLAGNTTLDADRVVRTKARLFGALGLEGDGAAVEGVLETLRSIESLSAEQVRGLLDFGLREGQPPIDG